MTRRWLYDFESGRRAPSLGAAIALASALGLTLTLEEPQRSDLLDGVFEDLG